MSFFDKNNGNGHRRSMVSAGGPVPIVGLPCTMKAVSVTVVLQCNCEAKTTLFLQGPVGVAAKCGACKRIIVFGGIAWKPGQQPEVNLSIQIDTDDAVEKAARAATEPPKEPITP